MLHNTLYIICMYISNTICMFGCLSGWMDEWDGWMDGWMDGGRDGCMYVCR